MDYQIQPHYLKYKVVQTEQTEQMAVTAFLTNESHTFPANSSGVVSDFSTGVTDIVVFEGITNKTSNYSFSGTGSSGRWI